VPLDCVSYTQLIHVQSIARIEINSHVHSVLPVFWSDGAIPWELPIPLKLPHTDRTLFRIKQSAPLLGNALNMAKVVAFKGVGGTSIAIFPLPCSTKHHTFQHGLHWYNQCCLA
jgi:hypothetical protein